MTTLRRGARAAPGDPFLVTRVAALLLAAAGGSGSAGVSAQEGALHVAKVALARNEAALDLEVPDAETLRILFQDGEAFINGRSAGSFGPGGALDRSWRALLPGLASLDGTGLADALREWSPPQDLPDAERGLAASIDRALEEAAERYQAPPADLAPDPGREDAAVRTLLRELVRSDRWEDFTEALEGVDIGDADVRIDEDVTIAAGTRIRRPLVVINGDLDVYGRITGDVVLSGGRIRVHSGGEVHGDIRLADGRITAAEGAVTGDVHHFDAGRRPEADQQTGVAVTVERNRSFQSPHPLRRGISGLWRTAQIYFALVVLAMIAIAFFPARFRRIADCAAERPVRSLATGLAGSILAVPIWILGIALLAVSVIGILLVPLWIPIFALAVLLAGLVGLIAVCRNLGQWLLERGHPSLDWLRSSNAIHTTLVGLALMLLFSVAVNVLSMGGAWFQTLRGLLSFAQWIVVVGASWIGFGAVLLTRGGRYRDPAAAAAHTSRGTLYGFWAKGADDYGEEP